MDEITIATENQKETKEQIPWYKTITLKDAKAFIQSNITSAARNFISIGYYLKHIRDNRLFLEDGHSTIWDFAQSEFGISKSTASRYMTMNDRFSKDGNSPTLNERYKEFDKSKLQEMLSLTEEQVELVTPEMKVQEIRSMRTLKEIPYFELEGQMEFEEDFPEILPDTDTQPFPEAVYPLAQQSQGFVLDVSELLQEETIATSQQLETELENQKDTEMDYETREKYCNGAARKLIEANHDWMIVDIMNRVLLVTESEKQLKELLLGADSTSWYFADPYGDGIAHVNFFQDYIQFWSGDIGGWVGDCEWFYLCAAIQRMWNVIVLENAKTDMAESVIDAEIREGKEQETALSEMDIARDELQKAKNLFGQCNSIPGIDPDDEHLARLKIKVAALASYVCDLDNIINPPSKPEQPELPILKNNDQRAAFVDAYETWTLWIETVETGERYYRYDLSDGTSMVVKVYHAMLFDYSIHAERWEDRCREGWGKQEYYLLQEGKFFRDCDTNRSQLIEKLKEIQKK